jgi:hypothetical protein
MSRTISAIIGVVLLVLGAQDCIGEETGPGPDFKHLKAMKWMIGDWEAEWVVPSDGDWALSGYPAGARVRATCSYSWMQKRNYIRLKFRDEINGKVVHEGLEIVGVDPESKKIMHWLFSILGGWGQGEWTVEGKTWKLKWWGTTADGTKLEGVSYMVPLNDNTHTWQIKDCKRNGKLTPDTPVVTYRRVNKKTD